MGADKLCSICRTISFDENGDLFNDSTHRGEWNWKTSLDLRHQPDCPLCRLVLFMLESTDSFFLPTEPISLEWDGHHRHLRSSSFRAALYVAEGSSSILSRQSLTLPITRPKIDLQRARSWLDMCMSTHTECRAYLTNSLELTELRLINVVTRSVEDVEMPCRYIALSYVWGGVPSIRLTTNNRATMSEQGILSKVWFQIPRTIRDAIEAVQELNEKYLWVDSLCLIQNDSTDMKKGIAVMDLIYEGALLTIIAASGAHANAGIPGVGGTCRTITQRIEQVTPDLRLTCHLDGNYLLNQTVYSQRGWT
jgi:Heterokaryon incompatibility protein (HET)